MIDPPRIANLLSAGQHNLNYFVRKRKIKCESVKIKCDIQVSTVNFLFVLNTCKTRLQNGFFVF